MRGTLTPAISPSLVAHTPAVTQKGKNVISALPLTPNKYPYKVYGFSFAHCDFTFTGYIYIRRAVAGYIKTALHCVTFVDLSSLKKKASKPAQFTTQGVSMVPCCVSTAFTLFTPISSVRTWMPVTGQFSITWFKEWKTEMLYALFSMQVQCTGNQSSNITDV